MQKHQLLLLSGLLAANLTADPTPLSLRTFFLGKPQQIPALWISAEAGATPVPLSWPTSQPSPPIKVSHHGQLQLLHSPKIPDPEQPAGGFTTISLPDSAQEVLLLGIVNNTCIDYMIVEDNLSQAQINDWLAINISDQPVKLSIGDAPETFTIRAQGSAILQPGISSGIGVKVIATAERKGSMRTFFSTYWPAVAGQRPIIIFYPDTGRMRVRRISDHFIQTN